MKLWRLLARLYRLPRILRGLVAVSLMLLIVSAPFAAINTANAQQISSRSVQLSDPSVDANGVNYNFGFTTITNGSIGSVSFLVCSNYLFNYGDPCTAPSGFDASSAVLTAQSGVTDFSMSSASSNRIVLGRPAATGVSPQPLTMNFSGITNPDAVGSYYILIATHASLNGSGPEIDYGIVLFAMNLSISITSEVPPYLFFCTGINISGFNCGTSQGNNIDFGELSKTSPRVGTSQMLASTNAQYGYSVTLAGSTLAAGTNTIGAMNYEASNPGRSQFGLNVRVNSDPSVGDEPFGPGATTPKPGYDTPNMFKFNEGDIVVSSGGVDDYRKFTISYIVNASTSQPAGRYVSTVSYICLANF